ncbi:MAG: SpoIIIAH-like family protein [Clostridia bacterium]|nr:SpoIIIAH-like family protein [Clostridia bacterium]
MKWERIKEKANSVIGKIGKKTIVTVCTVFVLGCAVVLNVILYNSGDEAEDGMKLAVDLKGQGNTETTQTSSDSTAISSYFQTMSLNRQQARDEAMEVLMAVAESQTALEDAKAAALSDMSRLATDIETESNIETMILSKGFTQCIAVISDGGCNVIVESEGLAPGEIAQITEIVYEQSGILPENLKIVEKNTTNT